MKIAFLFPGQGSQSVGMGKSLFDNFKIAQQTFEEAEDILKFNLTKICFVGPENILMETKNTQPAILTVSIAALRVLLSETGLQPDVSLGHSLGEYSALVCSQALNFSTALELVYRRGQFMTEAFPLGEGSMAAILGLDCLKLKEICQKVEEDFANELIVSIANINTENQTVISGHKKAVEEAMEAAKKAGAKMAVPLKVSSPFHCSLMKKAAQKMAEVLERAIINPLTIPYIANVDANLYEKNNNLRKLLTDQICSSVLWWDSMKRVFSLGIKEFYEIGPGKILTGMIKRINPEFKLFNLENRQDLEVISAS